MRPFTVGVVLGVTVALLFFVGPEIRHWRSW